MKKLLKNFIYSLIFFASFCNYASALSVNQIVQKLDDATYIIERTFRHFKLNELNNYIKILNFEDMDFSKININNITNLQSKRNLLKQKKEKLQRRIESYFGRAKFKIRVKTYIKSFFEKIDRLNLLLELARIQDQTTIKELENLAAYDPENNQTINPTTSVERLILILTGQCTIINEICYEFNNARIRNELIQAACDGLAKYINHTFKIQPGFTGQDIRTKITNRKRSILKRLGKPFRSPIQVQLILKLILKRKEKRKWNFEKEIVYELKSDDPEVTVKILETKLTNTKSKLETKKQNAVISKRKARKTEKQLGEIKANLEQIKEEIEVKIEIEQLQTDFDNLEKSGRKKTKEELEIDDITNEIETIIREIEIDASAGKFVNQKEQTKKTKQKLKQIEIQLEKINNELDGKISKFWTAVKIGGAVVSVAALCWLAKNGYDYFRKTPDAEIPDAEIPDAEIPDAEIPDAEIPDTGAKSEAENPCWTKWYISPAGYLFNKWRMIENGKAKIEEQNIERNWFQNGICGALGGFGIKPEMCKQCKREVINNADFITCFSQKTQRKTVIR